MKLKNKISGEIKEFSLFDGKELQGGVTLESLTKEWEDAPEEPKGIKDIYFAGATVYIEMYNQKEAIKVEEKLKAWKRLKDKGFRFDNWDLDADDQDINVLLSSYTYKGSKVYDFEKDLDLLFSGEDD